MDLDEALSRLPVSLGEVHSKEVRLGCPFIDVVRRFSKLRGTVALLSGGESDCARYNILGVEPLMILSGNLREATLEHAGAATIIESEPFAFMRQIVKRFALSEHRPLPLCAGLLGYLAYDLKDALEELPQKSVEDLHLPHFYWVVPSVLLIEDRITARAVVHVPSFGGTCADAFSRMRAFEQALNELQIPLTQAVRATSTSFVSGFSRDQYLAAVEDVRNYIASGDVYQVNLSQRFEAPFSGSAFGLFEALWAENPAAFFAYIDAGNHHIVSSSPERFLLMNGRSVETRPIKGTRPRGATSDEDLRLKNALKQSSKEDAELSMIVDLLRNDLGRVCRSGSICVSSHKRVESYENVHHLLSIVTGTLDCGVDALDLVCATFPGGSITGCPKIRAMEIIDELEPVRRHIYTGAIGYISFHDTMDLSIAIRTVTVVDERVVFSVGGGIVFDSNPSEEFDETLHKGRTIFSALSQQSAGEKSL